MKDGLKKRRRDGWMKSAFTCFFFFNWCFLWSLLLGRIHKKDLKLPGGVSKFKDKTGKASVSATLLEVQRPLPRLSLTKEFSR